jgi:hypothetical protein
LRSPDLIRLARSVWEDQRRFPLQIATVLSQQFAGHGLQFFKVNKTITHVSVARPHYLDPAQTPVSDGVKRIVDYVNAHPKCTRRQLMETFAPSPTVLPVVAAAEGQPPATPEAPAPTPEQNALIGDLHWLIHQGHVIEFANGTLETAKKPIPKPPKPVLKKEDTTAVAPVENVAAATPEPSPDAPATEEPSTAEPANPNQEIVSEDVPATVTSESAASVATPEEESAAPQDLDKHEEPRLDQGSGPSAPVASAEPAPAPVESPS